MKNKFILILSAVATPTSPFMWPTTTQIQWPSSPMGTPLTPDTRFHEFISYIYEWGISLGGIAVFIMLVWAGIEYLTSAGDPGKMRSAIKRIKSSILGLALLLTSWLILNTINPQLVRLAPLPSLWGGEPLLKDRIDIARMQGPPCEFIVVWPMPNFEGKPGKPISFISHIEGRPVEVQRRRIEGADAISIYSDVWASAKSFIKITDEELKMLEEGRYAIERYNSKGIRDEDEEDGDGKGMYRVGGFCAIEVYKTTRAWILLGPIDPCGRSLGQIQLPENPNFRKQLAEGTVTCVEIVQGIPMDPGVNIPESEEKQEEPIIEDPPLIIG